MSTPISEMILSGAAGREKYAERVMELTDFAAMNYGITPMEMEIIAASMISMKIGTPCWIIADTSRNEFWNHLKTAISTGFTAEIDRIRVLRPRYANQQIEPMLLNRPQTALFTDFKSDNPAISVHPRSAYPQLEAECVRLSVKLPWMAVANPNAQGELRRLLRLAVDPEHRKLIPSRIASPPEMLKVAVDMIARANPGLSQPQQTLANLRALVAQHAALHGRTEIEESDWMVVYRVVMDSIRPWTRKILQVFADHDGYQTIGGLEIATGLHHKLIVSECVRLHEAEVLKWPGPKGKGNRSKWIRLASGRGDDMGRLMRGEWEWLPQATA